MVSGMVLARLLTPRDFGILAMVTAVTGLADRINHFGLPQALVQRDRISLDQVRTLSRHGLRLTLRGAVVIALGAPVLAFVYDEPRVVPIMLVFAVVFVIQGLTIVHEGVLMRRLRFGTLAIADLVSMSIGVASGIGLALAGWGYWALVAQAVLQAVVRTSIIVWRGRWSDGGRTARGGRVDVAELSGYGSDVTRYHVLEYLARNVDRVLVGAVQGSQPLGFYDAAYRWSLYPLNQVAAPLSGVILASLARVRHDAAAYRRAFRAGLLPFFSLVIPALVFFAVEGERVILLLLGDQWGAAVPLFRILCLSGVAASIIRVSRWLFLVHGSTGRQVRWGLVYLPVMAFASAAGLPWGALGVAAGFSIGNWIMAPSAVWSALRDSALRLRDFAGVVGRPTTAAVVAAVPTLMLNLNRPGAITGMPGVTVLLRQVLVFSSVLLLVWLAIPGGRRRFAEAVALLAEAVSRPRSARRA
jgi:PST family polysaccharide transporter